MVMEIRIACAWHGTVDVGAEMVMEIWRQTRVTLMYIRRGRREKKETRPKPLRRRLRGTRRRLPLP